MRIIDCHSHIGHDIGCLEAKIDNYLTLASKEKITDALLMPVPNQIVDENEEEKLYLRWKFANGIVYYSDYYKNSLKNPYLITNEKLFSKINNTNANINMHFIPLIHPLLDTYDYLDYIKQIYKPVAIKIHGLAAGLIPKELCTNEEAIKKLKYLGLPIIVHTDYMRNKSNTFNIRGVNDAKEWCRLFNDNELQGYITHCARFEPEAIKLINESDNLVLGLGPTKLLSIAQDEMYLDFKSSKDLLLKLKKYVKLSKILFDVDYNWNYSEPNRNDIFDEKPVEDVIDVFKEDKGKVLSKNAERFFRI